MKEILAQEKFVAAFAVGLVDGVQVDIVWYVQIEPHHMYLVVLAQRHRPALARAVVDEDLEKGKVFCVALEIESKKRYLLVCADPGNR